MLGLLKKKTSHALKQPIQQSTFLVIDTELTGLDPKRDSIVSIGAIEMEGARVLLGDVFYRVVAPGTVNAEAVTVHGITPDETKHCPALDLVLPEFVSLAKDKVLVGHHIGLDLAFLNRALKERGMHPLENHVVDTFKIYTWLKRRSIQADAFYVPTQEPESLFEIARAYDIHVQNIHHALYDAFITAQLFQIFIHALKDQGVRTLKDLLLISSV